MNTFWSYKYINILHHFSEILENLIRCLSSIDDTHFTILRVPKTIIIYREDKIVPYIENTRKPNVNFIEDKLDFYSIFSEEEMDTP